MSYYSTIQNDQSMVISRQIGTLMVVASSFPARLTFRWHRSIRCKDSRGEKKRERGDRESPAKRRLCRALQTLLWICCAFVSHTVLPACKVHRCKVGSDVRTIFVRTEWTVGIQVVTLLVCKGIPLIKSTFMGQNRVLTSRMHCTKTRL